MEREPMQIVPHTYIRLLDNTVNNFMTNKLNNLKRIGLIWEHIAQHDWIMRM